MTSTVRAALASASLLTLIGLTPAFAQEQAPAAAAAAPEQAAPAAPAEVAPAPAAPDAAAPAAPAASATPVAGIAPPPEGKGQVIFFRPSRLGGAALSFSVHEGDKGVGKLGNGSYFILTADPGPHTFTIQSEATDSLTLEVDAGETYYVKQTIGMGVMVGRPHLQPAEATDFGGSKLKLSTKKATDLKPKT